MPPCGKGTGAGAGAGVGAGAGARPLLSGWSILYPRGGGSEAKKSLGLYPPPF